MAAAEAADTAADTATQQCDEAHAVSPRPAPIEAAGGEQPLSELDALEQELTQQVPQLFEIMNQTSCEVNDYELQLTQARKVYRSLLSHWDRVYGELRGQYGSALDRLGRYFDAERARDEAKERVQAVGREYSAAVSLHAEAKQEHRGLEDAFEEVCRNGAQVSLDTDQQDNLARATVRVTKCQQERDFREQEYAKALQEFQEAQVSLEAWRAQVGATVIERALPGFRQLQQHRGKLQEEQRRIRALAERVRHSKLAYHNSMRELDRISNDVHDLRRAHKEAAASQPSSPQACEAEARAETKPRLELDPLPPLPPEEAPEAKTPAAASLSAAPGERCALGEESEEEYPELARGD